MGTRFDLDCLEHSEALPTRDESERTSVLFKRMIIFCGRCSHASWAMQALQIRMLTTQRWN